MPEAPEIIPFPFLNYILFIVLKAIYIFFKYWPVISLYVPILSIKYIIEGYKDYKRFTKLDKEKKYRLEGGKDDLETKQEAGEFSKREIDLLIKMSYASLKTWSFGLLFYILVIWFKEF